MNTIKEYLTEDHRKCDELFALMEDSAAKSLVGAKEASAEFMTETERHLQMEEWVIFVEFENKTGMT